MPKSDGMDAIDIDNSKSFDRRTGARHDQEKFQVWVIAELCQQNMCRSNAVQKQKKIMWEYK